MLPETFSLYIHFPWCQSRCPYCDFNAHTAPAILPEHGYIDALIEDLKATQSLHAERKLISIFMGGGSPSLFMPESIERILQAIEKNHPIQDIEITLEANPHSVDAMKMPGYRSAGVNRISLGIQSFNDQHLRTLGRAHNSTQAQEAIELALKTFDRVNLDLMFGLPEQSLEAGLQDLMQAMQYPIEHLSWYQLTIEANTAFAKNPPKLPAAVSIEALYEAGLEVLKQAGFHHYEISAHTRKSPCRHNTHYWQGGDYLGIGAGAHSKWTFAWEHMERWSLWRNPMKYLRAPAEARKEWQSTLSAQDRLYEYFLNRSRMPGTLSWEECEHHTHWAKKDIQRLLEQAHLDDFISYDAQRLHLEKSCFDFNRVLLEKLLVIYE